MAFDIALAVFVLAGFGFGFRKGLIHAVLSLVAVLAGVIGALRFSELAGRFLLENTGIPVGFIPVIAAVLVFVLVFLFVRLVGWILDQFLKAIFLGFANKLAGGVLFGFLLLIVFSVLAWLSDQAGYTPDYIKEESATHVYVIQLAPLLFDQLGRVLPFLQGIFDSLKELLDSGAASPAPKQA